MFGGAAMNPIRVLARILADLHDDQGRVTVPGFYDGVPELPEESRAMGGAGLRRRRGVPGRGRAVASGGRAGRTALEMIWSRPTCEINGIGGGYTGAGSRPCCRRRPRPRSASGWSGSRTRMRCARRSAPMCAPAAADCKVEFINHGRAGQRDGDGSSGLRGRAGRRCRTNGRRRRPSSAVGGSIPVAGYFKTILGMDSMLIGFGRDDDQIHSPNEKYDLESFHKGIRSWARVLDALARRTTSSTIISTSPRTSPAVARAWWPWRWVSGMISWLMT
jgi:hypothetical protein